MIKEYGDEGKVRAAGKVMTKGKDYEVADGDIILSMYFVRHDSSVGTDMHTVKAGAAKA